MIATERHILREKQREAAPALCYHCGELCGPGAAHVEEKLFCCAGCRAVYELLAGRNLCAYYTVDAPAPGHTPKDHRYTRRFDFLDDESVISQLLDFSDADIGAVTFSVPGMHCSSCIWLLERLGSLREGILKSTVHFPRKEVTITFRRKKITLREIVVLLASVGYEPLISLRSATEKRIEATSRQLYYRIGVAGFAFGNVMLLSFPEYLARAGTLDPLFRFVFSYANLILSIPVFLYSGMEFYRSAWRGLRRKFLNIDVPISLGMLMLFLRSVWDIAAQTGPGFFDSFTGLVFFMLIGRIFQKKSYDAISFDRDFRSYFPLWVTVRERERETSIPLSRLGVGDRMIVRNEELVPADAILLRGEALIDYSFVTGESTPVPKKSGELVYAGGRQAGQAIELEVVKEISQSYLTRLWNDDMFTKRPDARLPLLVHRVGKYFTAALLLVALCAAAYWWRIDPGKAATVFTSVLIVACPCALALSSPFALGTVQRIFGNNQFYVKNTETVEAMARVDTIVFDKTGTLTCSQAPEVTYRGEELDAREVSALRSLVRNSTHPLSRQLHRSLPSADSMPVDEYEEAAGKGIRGIAGGLRIMAGSREWTGAANGAGAPAAEESAVYVSIDGKVKGLFAVANRYRPGLRAFVRALGARCAFAVLSGDSDREEGNLRRIFGGTAEFRFRQSPQQKMDFIRELRARGRRVLMVGDGLNDAGALKAADVGISVSEDINTFSPACDAILSAERFRHFGRFLRFARAGMRIVHASFGLSLAYNVAGLFFAVTGNLSPLVSAVLMPASSVSVVAFTTIAARVGARRLGLR